MDFLGVEKSEISLSKHYESIMFIVDKYSWSAVGDFQGQAFSSV